MPKPKWVSIFFSSIPGPPRCGHRSSERVSKRRTDFWASGQATFLQLGRLHEQAIQHVSRRGCNEGAHREKVMVQLDWVWSKIPFTENQEAKTRFLIMNFFTAPLEQIEKFINVLSPIWPTQFFVSFATARMHWQKK